MAIRGDRVAGNRPHDRGIFRSRRGRSYLAAPTPTGRGKGLLRERTQALSLLPSGEGGAQRRMRVRHRRRIPLVGTVIAALRTRRYLPSLPGEAFNPRPPQFGATMA